MYGHSRQGGCVLCQVFSMGSEDQPLQNGLIYHNQFFLFIFYFFKKFYPNNNLDRDGTFSNWS